MGRGHLITDRNRPTRLIVLCPDSPVPRRTQGPVLRRLQAPELGHNNSVSQMEPADCNVPEKVNKVGLCALASVFIIHSLGLRKRRTELKNSHFRVEEKEESSYQSTGACSRDLHFQ